jgi:hypothetical protein
MMESLPALKDFPVRGGWLGAQVILNLHVRMTPVAHIPHVFAQLDVCYAWRVSISFDPLGEFNSR